MPFEKIVLTSSFPANPSQLGAAQEGGLHLYIDNPRVIDLPESGEITFKYTRGPVTITEAGRGRDASASVDLHLSEICCVSASEVEGEENPRESEENEIDRLFAEARLQEVEESKKTEEID